MQTEVSVSFGDFVPTEVVSAIVNRLSLVGLTSHVVVTENVNDRIVLGQFLTQRLIWRPPAGVVELIPVGLGCTDAGLYQFMGNLKVVEKCPKCLVEGPPGITAEQQPRDDSGLPVIFNNAGISQGQPGGPLQRQRGRSF